MTTAAGDASPSERWLARIVRGDDGVFRAQTLEEHLVGVSRRAAEFGSAFGSGDWAGLAGLLHDVGKCHPRFQAYLRASSGLDASAGNPRDRFDHAVTGASMALQRLGDVGRVLAYVIAGHHAGLADWSAVESGGGALAARLEERSGQLAETIATGGLPPSVMDAPAPSSGAPVPNEEAMHLWVRMLFSCVVDADSLDAESFSLPERAAVRSEWPSLAVLEDRLQKHLARLPVRGPLDELRTRVRTEALRRSGEAQGFFSLTVPTGGGKTLTSLAFALAHARANGLRRVVYAIPYLGIIEQTAQVFREAVGDTVLEHHSGVDLDDSDWRSALAAENWDAPLVVTTTVQLFESLFAARRSRCRKLHNLAGSVIVLDEAQLLPTDFLVPILSVLRALVEGYRATVVLSTATQPVGGNLPSATGRALAGLPDVRELVSDPLDLARCLNRVDIEWPVDVNTTIEWADVAAVLAAESQVLCIVNTRRDARHLAALVPGAIQLTALMCAEHRSAVLSTVRARLAAGDPVRVVSTQLVEAGVDIDFPVVWRALTGLDSIVQAAGRCNREARLTDRKGRPVRGRVHVFIPPRRSPPGHLRHGEEATRSLLAATAGTGLTEPCAFGRYFKLLYSVAGSLDRRGVMAPLTRASRQLEFGFRAAAERFRMIDEDGTVTVVVPYGEGARLVDTLRVLVARGERPDRWMMRRLQRFTVSLRRAEFLELDRRGGLERLASEERFDSDLIAVLPAHYSDESGVVPGERDFSIGLDV